MPTIFDSETPRPLSLIEYQSTASMTIKHTILVSIMLLQLALLCTAQQNSFSIADIAKMNLDEKRQLFDTPMTRKLDDPSRLLYFYLIGIKDPDTITQRKAVQNLGWVVLGLQDMRRKGTPIPMDFSRLGELQQELGSRLLSPDADMRAAAIHTLAFTDAPNKNLETILLKLLERETNAQLRASIIDRMTVAGYDSNKFVQTILSLLLAPDDEVRDVATHAVAEIRPVGGLSKLFEALEQIPSQFIIEAISRYGAEALPYVPQLEKLAISESVRSDLRDQARRAIEAIRNPKPAAHTEPKVKAVPLVDVSQPQTPAPTTTHAETTMPSMLATTVMPPTSPTVAAQTPVPAAKRQALVWPWLVGIAVFLALLAFLAKRRG